ncbi:Arf-GAP with coiled-coil, ANK repeat and PH domain-containing protein 2 [Sarcoptes scabiei]|nr:Arf-GAP with coiled-coil, ANK repeat and PH domain-containing protein 2 [Sarcoptes scabiei]
METIVDPVESLRDSPQFRIALDKYESQMDLFEKTFAEVLKQCVAMIEISKQFNKTKHNFLSSLVNLCHCFNDEPDLSKLIRRFIEPLHEINKFENNLNEQHHQSFYDSISRFLNNDIGTIKELKRRFQKRSDDLDMVFNKHSQIPKNKQTEWKEACNMLTATKSCFQHLTLDYVAQLTLFVSRRRHIVLDSLLSMITAYGTHFHQCYETFDDMREFNADIASKLIEMHNQSNKLEKLLSNRHHLVQQHDSIPPIIKNGETIRLEGYLFKRTTSTFKSWNRRWFILQNHQLVYQKRSNEKELVVMEEDLRLCNARPAIEIDRRFCFEVVSPTKNHLLQAESEESCQQWLNALQAGIDAAYSSNRDSNCSSSYRQNRNNSVCLESSSTDSVNSYDNNTITTDILADNQNTLNNQTSSGSSYSSSISKSNLISNASFSKNEISKILSIPGNEKCADCGCPDPVWASINLGITLCIECSGVHRSLGVHLSKVRSLTLDHLDYEQINVMLELGNTVFNQIYEYAYPVNEESHVIFNRTNHSPLSLSSSSSSLSESNEMTNQKGTDFFSIDKNVNEKLLSTSSSSSEMNPNTQKTEIKRIDSKSNRNERKEWIKSKYVDKQFVPKITNSESDGRFKLELTDHNFNDLCSRIPKEISDSESYASRLLYEASSKSNLQAMILALALGAKINWQNLNDSKRTSLIQAVSKGTMTACEFLMLNGANCNIQDEFGNSALHYAVENSNIGQTCLLLKRGADVSIQNLQKEDVLSIALKNACADIVTVLRLKKLKDEMRNEELGSQSDDTFNEVIRDFARNQIIAESNKRT